MDAVNRCPCSCHGMYNDTKINNDECFNAKKKYDKSFLKSLKCIFKLSGYQQYTLERVHINKLQMLLKNCVKQPMRMR